MHSPPTPEGGVTHRKTENGKRKTENGKQKTENRKQKTEIFPTFALVKPLVLILTFVVLLLNGIPCCLADECAEETESQATHQQEEPCDGCSPFLSCGTCAGFVVQMEFPAEPAETQQYRTDVFEDLEFHYSEFISRIWQPPQYS